MDPSLTRAEAHKVFGELYRKERAPERQSEVDRVVSETTDIFARIRRIEEIDAEYERQDRSARTADRQGGARSAPMRGGGAGRNGASKKSDESQGGDGAEAKPKKIGFFQRLMGGALASWGVETATIQSGLFGSKLRLSSRSVKIFTALKEEQLVSTIKAFRIAIGSGWQVWDPHRYNVVMAAYQFFVEFTKMGGYIRKATTPDELLKDSIKMQSLYVSMYQYPRYEKILMEDFVDYIKSVEPSIAGPLKQSMKYLLELPGRTPNMRNTIIALYVLSQKKLVTWEEVLRNIKVAPPVIDHFRAPESVLGQISARIKIISEELRLKKSEIEEISEIQNKYFHFDDQNRIQTSFLDPICMDVIKRAFSEKFQNDAFVKSQKRQPHRLLNLIVRDFDIVYLPLLDGTVAVKGENGTENVVVFKQGLFRSLIDELSGLQRDVDVFVKKNIDITYTFKDFHTNVKGMLADESLVTFFSIVKRANKIFNTMAFNLKTVIVNHRMAVESSKKKGGEKLDRTKALPIESFDIGMRFLPYHDKPVVSTDRMNGKTVSQMVDELLMNLYNYLYIFKDEQLLKTLSSSTKLKGEIKKIEEELGRISGTPSHESDG